MIVQCEQCNTRFKLDDAKVREEGVKVRCSKCRHIFIVRKEPPEQVEEADFDTLLSGLIASPHDNVGVTSRKDATLPVEPSVIPVNTEIPVEAPSIDFEFGSADSRDDSSVSPFEVETEQPNSYESVSQGEDSPFDTLPQKGATDLEYSSDFSLGESTDATEVAKVQGMQDEYRQSAAFEEELIAVPSDDHNASTDFPVGVTGNEESVAAEWPTGIEADVVLSKDGTSSVAAITDKENDSFAAISWDFAAPDSESAQVEPVNTPVTVTETASVSISANLIPPEETPVQETQKFTSPSSIAADDELSSLAITSRRRGSSVVPVIVTAISVLVIIGLAGAGFFMLNKGPTAFDKVGLGALVRWVGLDKGEEGSIEIRNSTSEFLKNKVLGEIFVIRGEAVNAFRKPRASIQVKATLYGAKGAVVGSKTSYCGNPLTKEQLTTLPLAKIEAAMGNQFGDSLANLGIQPGKAIPFVIVLTNVPTDASEFGLEIVGSTVASQ